MLVDVPSCSNGGGATPLAFTNYRGRLNKPTVGTHCQGPTLHISEPDVEPGVCGPSDTDAIHHVVSSAASNGSFSNNAIGTSDG